MKRHTVYNVLGILGAVCLPVVATAALLELTSFKEGDVISSSNVNANFSALNEKIDALETLLQERPPLGRFCGVTSTPVSGDMGGYKGANQLCSTDADDCSAESHICTAAELVAEGQGKPEGTNYSGAWYASGVWSLIDGNVGAAHDCLGFTSSAPNSGHNGASWVGSPSYLPCAIKVPVACCH